MCDNTTAINYISAMGGTKSVQCNAIAYDIWEWAIVRNILFPNMQKDKDCYNFMLTDHVKQDRPGKVFGNLRLYKYLTPELCVYTTLQQCLTITSSLRVSTKLLISYIRPFNAVTSSTIARWIKAVLLQAVLQLAKLLLQFLSMPS